MNIDVFAPDQAPARPDLGFLRHRVRPRPAAAPAVSPAAPAAPAAPSSSRSGLDLSGPAPVKSAPSGTRSSSLDLSAPAPPAPAAPAARSSLDLSTPAAAPPPATPPAPGRRRPVRPLPRARSGERTLLTPKTPTVTLNRLQSGVGVLTIEAACSPAVGDLRIGAAYQLADGHSSLVSRSGGMTTAPRDSRRPVIAARAEQYERLLIDLRQSRQLSRLVVLGFSESGGQLAWGGTLILTTAGGARIELPLERPASSGVTVLLSIYNIRGEFVVRAEMENFAGSIRTAVQAYGFDRISWLDDRTPVA
ncbi:hypothetical protein [Jatrophihabitans sp.]|uniref:hypothetical protein n=1 Tax=Jatrophihabitans sp. TaxID=1932789 RepID=UPI002C61E4AC|nr:hypothetical protein [Jatrophihabitans sp.]